MEHFKTAVELANKQLKTQLIVILFDNHQKISCNTVVNLAKK